MALVTAQQRQTLRLPTPDLSVDSIDQLALLGIWQVESSASEISTNQKRWILRLPIVDASVDELDAWGFLQIPAAGGGGNTTDGFSLSWNLDPTWLSSNPEIIKDGLISKTLGGFIMAVRGIVGDRPAGGPEGYGGESMYNSEAQRRKRRKERIRELQEEIRRINRWR